jgi:hypothetical protein
MRVLAFVCVLAACGGSSSNDGDAGPGGDARPDGTLLPPDAPMVTPPCAGRVGFPDWPSLAVHPTSSPVDVVLADFDGDGKLDVAYASGGNGALVVARGHGDGTFAAPLTVATGGGAIMLNAIDADGDGALDLVTLDYQAHAIRVLPGAGDGTFGPALVTTGAFGEHMALADLTGDGRTARASQ